MIAGEADTAARAHVDSCSECRFFHSLSRDLEGSSTAHGSVPAASGLGRPFEEVIAHALATGEPLLGRFRVERILGRGGQGVVVSAWDQHENESVAVKLARCDAGSAEVANAHRVRHPGVCRIYFSERHGDIRLVVMELIDGPTLEQAVRDLEGAERLRIFCAVADAIQAAHDQQVLHLDLKPHNVLLRDRQPIVTDFGMSVRADPDARAPGGTPAYMAPEQRRGRSVDGRADVYALGVMLRELAPAPDRRVARAIARATAEDPAARFADVASLRAAVDPDAGVGRRRRRVLLLVAGAAAALALLATIAVLVVPPPAGSRARWYPDLWGEDTLGGDLWNVAADVDGEPVAAIEASESPTGCARNARELLDGIAHYQDPYHGYAFPALRPLCIPFDLGPQCLDAGAGAGSCTTRTGRPGQLQGSSTCDRDQSLVITLDRPRLIAAVRAWFHDATPQSLAVELEVDGAWVTASRTHENMQSIPIVVAPGAGGAAPVTLTFGPLTARRIRFSVRCDRVERFLDRPGNPVWLTEVEVFSPLGRLAAWRRRLFGP